MAANRRRSTRKSAVHDADSPVPTKKFKTESQSEDAEAAAEEDSAQCPACKDEATPADAAEVDEESWIRCDGCQKWHHWRCVKDGMPPEVDDPAVLNKWFCKPCLVEEPKRTITVRPPARKSARQKKAQEEYVSLHGGTDPGTAGRWVALMRNKPITQDSFKRMKGSDLSLEWIDSDPDALKEPIVIETPEGLGMKMPGSDFTVQDVAGTIGEDHPVEVIDVATQSNSPGWTVGKWAEYFNTPASERDKIRNVISLEISATTLADQILPPRLVRDLDWVEKYWPSTKKGRGHQYPKVQLYCLMGVADAWTDWHVDFAGSSVYYHIVKGAKTFYFIRPSAANLAAYERWSSSDMQTSVWLGDMVDEVIKVELTTGNTMLIPTGWIHAVATPQDTLVFGGNFLHSYNIGTQLKICGIENRTNVPKKFRFPHFNKLCWYVAEKLVRDLKAKEEFSQRVIDNLEALTTYLMGEVHSMERGSEQAKKVAKEHVPGDRIKDAPALARELRWRLRLAAGVSSDDEGHGRRKTKPPVHPQPESSASPSVNGHGTKRKREAEDNQDEPAAHPFRNFRPKPWTISHEISTPEVTLDKAAPRPLSGQDEVLEQHWGEWKDTWEGDGLEGADVRRQQHTLVRVRRTEDGLERQRIERTVEKWTWRERKDVEMDQGSGGEASATVVADGGPPATDQLESASGDESAINVDS